MKLCRKKRKEEVESYNHRLCSLYLKIIKDKIIKKCTQNWGIFVMIILIIGSNFVKKEKSGKS